MVAHLEGGEQYVSVMPEELTEWQVTTRAARRGGKLAGIAYGIVFSLALIALLV
jgi:hypothetical protein